MKYQNETGFRHDAPETLGVLMVNLGTPDAPSTGAVRRYLAEFLSDPRVIEMPRLLWMAILHGVILRIRPKRSAHAYRQVWSERGSPLLDISRRQEEALQRALEQRNIGPLKVELAMRYGSPSIAGGLGALRRANVRRLLVLPMYPQYSATTTASAFDAVSSELQRWRWLPELRFVNQYHDEPGYIQALADSIRRHWDEHGQADKLLFSFHGIPREYFLGGDPYYCHCQKTARLVVERLAIPEQRWGLSFQSRVGNQEWLRPYTDQQLREWGAAGVGSVQVICPGFSADCLETLEEIVLQNRDFFLQAGGREYGYIPALNDDPAHIAALTGVVARHIGGWPERDAEARNAELTGEAADRLERARRSGAEV
jgi:ferrochelatase